MKNIINYSTLFCIITIYLLSCSARTPAPIRMGGEAAAIEGRYRFYPSVFFYLDTNAGEIVFERSKKGTQTRFRMAIAGMMRTGSIRVRVYEGLAYRVAERIELRADQCFVFGKSRTDGRLSPLENWNCSHLVFALRTENGDLVSVSDEGTRRSDWFGPIRAEGIMDRKDAFFVGQAFSVLEDGRLAVYAYRASKLLRNGQTLHLRETDGHERGTAVVVERVGDIVIVSPERSFTKTNIPLIAYTTAKPDYGGLFN